MNDSRQYSFGIIGDGGMGTLCALLLADSGAPVTLWSAFADQAEAINRDGENRRFMPEVPLPDSITATSDPTALPREATFLVSAVPTAYLRDVMRRIGNALPEAPILSVSKGIENDTLLRPSEIIRETLPGHTVGVLSGPCIAFEAARGMPATVVVAGGDDALGRAAVAAMTTPTFRVYRNADALGVELGGALKNVIALAAGICDGLELGVNAKAALLTRGLAEIARLGVAMGARPETFAGLAGVGDLFTTCVSPHGRNRNVGEAIGRGQSLEKTIAAMGGQVAEGVNTTRSAVALAAKFNVDMPITTEIERVLFENKRPDQAIRDLMARPSRSEDRWRQ